MRRSKWAVGLLLCATPACATDAAVALLADVRNPTTTDAMLRNLATLARTCDWARRYDVIVFHEGKSDALRPRLEALGNRTRLRLRARDISDEFATHAPATTDWPRRRLRTFGIGYRRMCRFWFAGVFEVRGRRRRGARGRGRGRGAAPTGRVRSFPGMMALGGFLCDFG